MTTLTADEIAAVLDLAPHPDGGRFRETFRDEHAATAFRLLAAGESVAWARLTDQVEVWQFYDGAPMTLSLAAAEGGAMLTVALTRSPAAGGRAEVGVPAGWWRSAESAGDWSLVSVTVAATFDLPDYLAPD